MKKLIYYRVYYPSYLSNQKIAFIQYSLCDDSQLHLVISNHQYGIDKLEFNLLQKD